MNKGYHGLILEGFPSEVLEQSKTFGEGIQADTISQFFRKITLEMLDHCAYLAEELAELSLHDSSNIAAVIIEPMAGSAGVIPPPRLFAAHQRTL